MSSWFLRFGFAELGDGLLIGAYPLDESDVGMLTASGVQRILNLVEDEEYGPGDRETVEQALAQAGIREERLALTDFGGLPAAELEAAVNEVNAWLDKGLCTYLHCRAGWQRSAAVAAAVIAVRKRIGLQEALELVQARKPSADPLPHQREDLLRWWRGREVDSKAPAEPEQFAKRRWSGPGDEPAAKRAERQGG